MWGSNGNEREWQATQIVGHFGGQGELNVVQLERSPLPFTPYSELPFGGTNYD